MRSSWPADRLIGWILPVLAILAEGAWLTVVYVAVETTLDGQAPLLDPVPGQAERERLHVAVVIPPFGRGSGGHTSIAQLVLWLERMGHTCSLWVYDPEDRHSRESGSVLRRRIVQEFAPVQAPVFKGFDDWYGADVAVATG